MADILAKKVAVEHFDPVEHRRQIATLVNDLSENRVDVVEITIADDSAVSIRPRRRGGFMYITASGDTATPSQEHSGLVYYDIGSDLAIEKNAGWTTASSQLDVSTSDVTGTTGTDTNITVAVQADEIKVENRIGSETKFQLAFL